METRHTMHRSLRSGSSLIAPVRGRSRIRGFKHTPANRARTKVPVSSEKAQNSEKNQSQTTEKNQSQTTEKKPPASGTSLEKNAEQVTKAANTVAKSADPVCKVTSTSGQISLEQSSRRSRFRGRGAPLTSRGKSYIPNLKSKVDWSRNTDDDSAEDSDSTAVSNDSKNTSSTTNLRSRSIESSAALTLGTKSQHSAPTTNKGSTPTAMGRLRSDSPSQSPVARVKSSTSDSSPSSRTRSRAAEESPSSKASPATRLRNSSSDSVVKHGPGARSQALSTEDSSKNSPAAKVKGSAQDSSKPTSSPAPGATTRSGGVVRGDAEIAKSSETMKNTPAAQESETVKSSEDSSKKPIKVSRAKRQVQSTRTQSMSPVSRTRSGTPIGRQQAVTNKVSLTYKKPNSSAEPVGTTSEQDEAREADMSLDTEEEITPLKESQDEDAHHAAMVTSPPVRRGRGRPRRSVNPTEVVATNAEASEPSPDTKSRPSQSSNLGTPKALPENNSSLAMVVQTSTVEKSLNASTCPEQNLASGISVESVPVPTNKGQDKSLPEESKSKDSEQLQESSAAEFGKDVHGMVEEQSESPAAQEKTPITPDSVVRKRGRGRPRKFSPASAAKKEAVCPESESEPKLANKTQDGVESKAKDTLTAVAEVKPVQMMTRRKNGVSKDTEVVKDLDSKMNEPIPKNEFSETKNEEHNTNEPDPTKVSNEKQPDAVPSTRRRGRPRKIPEVIEAPTLSQTEIPPKEGEKQDNISTEKLECQVEESKVESQPSSTTPNEKTDDNCSSLEPSDSTEGLPGNNKGLNEENNEPNEGSCHLISDSSEVPPSDMRGVKVEEGKAKVGRGRGRPKKRRGRSKIGSSPSNERGDGVPVEDLKMAESVERSSEVEDDCPSTESGNDQSAKVTTEDAVVQKSEHDGDGEMVKAEKLEFISHNVTEDIGDSTSDCAASLRTEEVQSEVSPISTKPSECEIIAEKELKDSNVLNEPSVRETALVESKVNLLHSDSEEKIKGERVEEVKADVVVSAQLEPTDCGAVQDHNVNESKEQNVMVDEAEPKIYPVELSHELETSDVFTPVESKICESSITSPGHFEINSHVYKEDRVIDDLQVPFHDTDEAEISDLTSKLRNSAVEGEQFQTLAPDASEPHNRFVSIDGPQRGSPVREIENSAKETCHNIPSQPETGEEGLPCRTSSKGKVSDLVANDTAACPVNIDNAQSSRLLVGKDSDNTAKSLSDLSPSKSEWSARKVTEGVKIVLKLKRKSSSDRGEGSTPTTPTSTLQSDFSDIKNTSEDKIESIVRKQHTRREALPEKASSEPPPEVGAITSTPDDGRQRKKRRRNEFDLLNVTERSYHKKKKMKIQSIPESQPGPILDSTDSEISELTGDSASTLGTSASIVDSKLQDFMNVDVKTEFSVQEEPAAVENAPLSSVQPTVPSEQKVEKLVIKRRIPSPTKMKTRGKQNRLWYLFAKQSKSGKAMKKDKSPGAKSSMRMSGTVEELRPMCKPCNVKLIDLIKYLSILSHDSGAPGDSSPKSMIEGNSQEASSENSNPEVATSMTSPLVGTEDDAQIDQESLGDTLTPQSKKRPLPESPDSNSVSEARMVKIPWPSSGSTSPVAKKSKLEPSSEGERQFLSFIMPKAVQEPSTPSGSTTGTPTGPKPVLTRAPVTARKTMKSASSARKSMQSSKSRAVPLESHGLHPMSPVKGRTMKFSCLNCPFTSSIRSVMSQHVYSHADIMPYSCGNCNGWQGSRSSVQSHNKQAHPGMPADIVKNAEICEEDYYITCDASKTSLSETSGLSSSSLSHPQNERLDMPSFRPDQIKTAPAIMKSPDGHQSKGKSVSLLNPAVLTAQVAASKAGIPAKVSKPTLTKSSESESSPVQLVVTTSRPVSTAPVVNVLAQVNPTLVSTPPSPVTAKTPSAKEGTAAKAKIPRRPRIPLLDNVDPNQPYYQCRHCTHASNSLQCIQNHVASKHNGEQCYQCPLCEHTYFKSESAVEKHNAKHHPNETVGLQLQPGFYDVHQKDSERTVLLVETSLSSMKYPDVLSPQGQSPLHVIVSPDGVTVLGTSDTSPASVVSAARSSPQASPAHLQVPTPQPVLSPPPRGPPHKPGSTPPRAVSPQAGHPVTTTPSPPAATSTLQKQTPRVILKVPTVSPPQRAIPNGSHSQTNVPAKLPSAAATGVVPFNRPPVLSSPGKKVAEVGEVLNLCRTENKTLSQTKSPSDVLPTEADPCPVESSSNSSSDVQPKPTPSEPIVSDQESAASDEGKPSNKPQTSGEEEEVPKEDGVSSHGDSSESPPPLMILNVVSLASQSEDNIGEMISGDMINDGSAEAGVSQAKDDVETAEGGQGSAPQVPPLNTEPSELPESYSCKFCEKIYINLDDVINHIAETHKMRFWYACPYCPFGCSRHKSNMLRHIARSHQGESDDVQITITDEDQYFTRVLGEPDGRESSPDRLNKSPPIEVDDILDVEADPLGQQPKIEKVEPGQDLESLHQSGFKPLAFDGKKFTPIKTEPLDEAMSEPKTSEKSCSTDDMVSNKKPAMVSRIIHHEDDDTQVANEPRKQRPVGEIKPTLVRAPLSIPSGFNRLGSACRPIVPLQQRVKPTSQNEKNPEKTKAGQGELGLSCGSYGVAQNYVDGPEDDDVIVTETHSSVIAMPQLDQPLNLQIPRLSEGADQPTDLTFSPSSRSSVSTQPDMSEVQDLSKPRQSKMGLSAENGVISQLDRLKSGETKVAKTPPPAHQSSQRYNKPPLVIEPTPSPTHCFRSRPLNEPIMIAPLADSPKATQARLNSPTVRKPQPAHSHRQITGEGAGKSVTKSQNSTPQCSTSLSTSSPSPVVGHAKTAPHRPVSKTMPPLIRIEPGKQAVKSQPPPLIAFHSSQSNVLIANPAKTSVIQTLCNEPQSALSSLEMMTKRGVDDLPTKRPALSEVMKKLIDDRYPDEEAARKAFSVFNLKPPHKPKKSKPTAAAGASSAVATQSPLPNAPLNIPQVPVGINKWRQFQSKNRPTVRPPQTFAGFQGAPPGSLGMAAAAFQQAHLRRTAPMASRHTVRPQMSPATAAAAAASFMQRTGVSASQSAFSSTASLAPINSSNRVQAVGDNIPCPYCNYKAEDADAIHDHILSHEPDIPIHWSCPYCPLPNRMSKPIVTKHIQNCHPKLNVVYIPFGVPLQ